MKKAEKLVEKIKKSYPSLLIGIILFFLSSVVTLYQGGKILKDYYLNTVGIKNRYLNDINKLSAGVNIGYFKDILGNPAFIDESENKEQWEYVFVRDLFYTQVITDNNGAVLSYAITTRNKKFNPFIKLFDSSDTNKIVLGESKFSEIKDEPKKIYAGCGARRFHYIEEYYLGNSGNYQYYIFSINDAGFVQVENEIFFCKLDYSPKEENNKKGLDTLNLKDDEVGNFRKNEILNTFAVTAPFISFDDLDFGIGPDYDKVRILEK